MTAGTVAAVVAVWVGVIAAVVAAALPRRSAMEAESNRDAEISSRGRAESPISRIVLVEPLSVSPAELVDQLRRLDPPDPAPRPVTRVTDAAGGSHIEPPREDSWPDLEQLQWWAAVARVDSGLELEVVQFGDRFSIAGVGSSMNGLTYLDAWKAISALSLVARMTRRQGEPADDPERFWPPYGTDPVVDAIMRAHHYRTDQLPRTALELLDCLGQIGYSVSQSEDLHLENPHSHGGAEGLDGHPDQIKAGGLGQGADGGLDVGGTADTAHEDSSRFDEGADTPVDRSVGVATDIGWRRAGRGHLSAPGRPPDLSRRHAVSALTLVKGDRIEIVVGARRAPDGRTLVLLQLPSGSVLITPEAAREVAGNLQVAAVDAEVDDLRERSGRSS